MRRKNELRERMETQGFENLKQFMRRSCIPLSDEVVRTAIYEGKKVGVPTLILILKYLGYTPNEIKDRLVAMGDKEMSALIGDHKGATLMGWENELLRVAKAIRKADPKVWDNTMAMLRTIHKSIEEGTDGGL